MNGNFVFAAQAANIGPRLAFFMFKSVITFGEIDISHS